MNHLDLFSGIGGFALAARWCGFKTIGFSETDGYCCKILKQHWPDVPNYGDIRTMRGVPCDLITGGFPCQPYSLAGKRGGASDDRALWPEMLRVIAESKPRWVLGENVPGIINMELDRVLSDLENLGYSCWPIVVPACAIDARHRRRRVWIVAHAEKLNRGLQLSAWNKEAGDESARGGEALADTDSNQQWWRTRSEQVGRKRSASEDGNNGVERGTQWCAEPGMGRVAYGIPHRVDRLKGLGNSIVPQVACEIMRHMKVLEHFPCGGQVPIMALVPNNGTPALHLGEALGVN